MLRGPLLTGPPFFSLMSPGFVWTSLTGELGSGGCEINVLLKFVLQSMIAMAGFSYGVGGNQRSGENGPARHQ